MHSDAALIARHSKVNDAGCWIWTRSVNNWGYGRIGKGRAERAAHRLSYHIFRGPIPEGMMVLHRCDVSRCVNPGHLFLGTNADNMRDMAEKGRVGGAAGKRGESNAQAKLSLNDVQKIRSTPIMYGSISALAREYGVSRRAIRFVVEGSTWSA
jgi:hypothetical protein